MSIKIDLEEPFKSLWKHGYLVTNKEPRRNVILYNSNRDRTTISYARYLMSVHLGRLLDKDEIVDHINGNKLDDRLENYQILTVIENNRKGCIENGRVEKLVRFICGSCNKEFIKPKCNTHLTIKSKKSDYCSRSCGAKASHHKKPSKIVEIFKKESYN